MPVQIDRPALKLEAKELLRTASVPPVRFTLFFLAIALVLDEISAAVGYMLDDSVGFAFLSFSFVSVLTTLLSTVLLAGFAIYCLGINRRAVMPYDCLFDAFPFAGKVILLELLQGFLIGLGLSFFVAPGIYLFLCYPFALYHLCEDPQIGVVEALRRSRMEMNGYKAQLLLLLLSFLPLLLAAALPLAAAQTLLLPRIPDTFSGALLSTLISGVLAGVMQVVLLPYIELARVGFYRRAVPESPESGAGDLL